MTPYPVSPDEAPVVLGVDTGGTFTDFVMVDRDGKVRTYKVPSSRHDPGGPVIKGLGKFPRGQVHRMVHGTTVATNALLEHTTARTALITTAGFEDVIEIGRQNRPVLYALHPVKPPPIIPRDLRFGVRERMLHNGSVLTPLDPEEARRVVAAVCATGAETVAICLLHAYANSAHEEALGALAEEAGLMVSLSSRVLAEFREYERTATVAVNAALRPVMERYLNRLERNLEDTRLSVMQSAGGVIPAGIAARVPVHTVLSGPAGGVIAAASVAGRSGEDRVITFDMGGTSTDVCLCDRAPALATDLVIAGHPIRVPVLDIHTVGAGGGSIARRDAGGGLAVGPESAGADPGPVCYGRGARVTVTDANLFLGRLDPAFFLDGRMPIYPERVRGPMERLANELGMDPVALAEGIVTVANAVMERAIRVVSVERGHDPREFTLVSFGGAGGLHAALLARSLGIRKVLVPADAGVFSAYGMAVADVTRDFSQSLMQGAAKVTRPELDAVVAAMVSQGEEELAREGVSLAEARHQASLDMRYQGQSHELSVPLDGDPVAAFHQAHERAYGFSDAGRGVEIVHVRARLTVPTARRERVASALTRGDAAAAVVRTAKCVVNGAREDVDVYARRLLARGIVLRGPAVIGEGGATTFVPRGALVEVDAWANLVIRLD
jgi:N-methylhydantoinase A